MNIKFTKIDAARFGLQALALVGFVAVSVIGMAAVIKTEEWISNRLFPKKLSNIDREKIVITNAVEKCETCQEIQSGQ